MVSESLWFEDGLCFECTQCGNCCSGAPGAVWVDDDDIGRIAEYTGKGEGEIRVMHTRPFAGRTSLTEFANGDCTFFDAELRRFRIYPVRPTQCRTWPLWSSNLRSSADWDATQEDCPGAGQGRLVTRDEIVEMLSEIDI